MVPQIVNTFFATVVKKIEDVADKYGYNVLVASSNETFEKEKKNIDIFLANRCDGIILSISKATTSYEHIKQIQDMGVPLVLFDRTAKELDVSKVVADDADAAFKIVQPWRSQKNRPANRPGTTFYREEPDERVSESHDAEQTGNQYRLHRQM